MSLRLFVAELNQATSQRVPRYAEEAGSGRDSTQRLFDCSENREALELVEVEGREFDGLSCGVHGGEYATRASPRKIFP